MHTILPFHMNFSLGFSRMQDIRPSLFTHVSVQADWKIVERGWHAHVLGEAPHKFTSALEALKKLKEADPSLNDQYYPPWVVVDGEGKAVGTIEDGDAVVCWNYRADRVIQVGGGELFDRDICG